MSNEQSCQVNDEKSSIVPITNFSNGNRQIPPKTDLEIEITERSAIEGKQSKEESTQNNNNIGDQLTLASMKHETDSHSIPPDMLSSVNIVKEDNMDNLNIEFDDDAVSAVAAAATMVNRMDLKRKLDEDFNSNHERSQSPSLNSGVTTDENCIGNHMGLDIQLDSLSSINYLSNSESSKLDSLKSHTSRTKTEDVQKSKAIKFTPNKTTQNIKNPQLLSTNTNLKKGPDAKRRRKEAKLQVKHSRFFKVVGNETTKHQRPTSFHHYNPYRYPQNRSKLNTFPDFIRTRNDATNGSDLSGPDIAAPTNSMFHEPLESISNDQTYKIPVLKPTIDEFKDIYTYIESIKDIGMKYGAVKVVPPKEFVPRFSINLESFWIKTTRQYWNSPADELNARVEFYTHLKEILIKKKILLNKLPCIDKRAIDLYRLFRVVNLRGGFENCCNEKLWAQIGRELGFYGKISSSLSSSIKSVYHKYLCECEAVFLEKKFDFLNRVRNNEDTALFTKEEFERNQPEVPIVIGSATTYVRNRKILADAGFCTYYDQATTQKKGITLNESSTLPNYDFYNWLGFNSEEDSSPTELKISSLYTLKQFYDKSRILKNLVLTKTNEPEHYKFEDLNYLDNTFWKLLRNPNLMLETEVALRQPTTIHESSYENKFISEKCGCLPDTILEPSNYNNTTIADNSLLQYTSAYSDSIYHSYLNFCMFYGSQSWTMEDHWLYKVDYHYLGDAKSLYFIPPADQEKYERLVEKYFESRTKFNKRATEALVEFENRISNFDMYNACVENQVCYDFNLPRSRPVDSTFSQFINDKTFPKRYNNDIMFSPQFLRENGISTYHTFQDVGEMIIKFPKTYSAQISLGTSVTEAINIAPPDWLAYSLDASKWLQKQQLTPQFSTFAMLLKIAHESTNKKILRSLLPVFERRILEELDKRTAVRPHMNEHAFDGNYDFQDSLERFSMSQCDTNSTNPEMVQKLSHINKVTDVDLCDIFPTFVMLSSTSTNNNLTISLDRYLAIRDDDSYDIDHFDCKMVSFVSDEYLKNSLAVIKAKLESPRKWLERYHTLLSQYCRPPLSKVLPFLNEAKAILEDASSLNDEENIDYKQAVIEYKSLKKYVQRTEEWRNRAQHYLRKSTIMLPIKEFKELTEQIKNLMISVDEVSPIMNLAKRVKLFDETAAVELSKSENELDFEKLKSLHCEGLDINIKLNSFIAIDKVVRKKQWTDVAARGASTFEELKSLYEQGCSLNLLNNDDLELLESLKKKIELSESVIKKFESLKQENQKVSYDSLLEMDRISAPLPLPDVKRYTRDLINEYNHISEIIVPLIDTIKEKLLIVSSADSLSNKITTYLQFSEHIGSLLANIKVESTLKTLCKFEEFEAESKLFKEQVVDGPSSVSGELSQIYHTLVSCYKTRFNMNSLSDTDSLNHLILYDTDIMNSNNDRYCVCRQTFEGSMVECEKCQQWFHFGCIGYTKNQDSSINLSDGMDTQKYICPLCDIEERFPNTRTFRLDNSNRVTFEKIVMIADTIMNKTSISRSMENAFLQVAKRYHELYNTIISSSSIQISKTEGDISYVLPDDTRELRILLEKLNGLLICFEELQNKIHVKYKMLSAPTSVAKPSLDEPVRPTNKESGTSVETAINTSATTV